MKEDLYNVILVSYLLTKKFLSFDKIIHFASELINFSLFETFITLLKPSSFLNLYHFIKIDSWVLTCLN